jgi:hypothetical protein
MRKNKTTTYSLITAYLFAIVLANWSIERWGPEAAIYNAFVFIGLDLVARDYLSDLWQGKFFWTKITGLILSGSLLSYFLVENAEKIAVASAIAFGVAAIIDTIVYQSVKRKPWLERSNTSNIFGSFADSIVFQTIAFGWAFPFIFAQAVAKIAGGVVWSIIINRFKNENTSTPGA